MLNISKDWTIPPVTEASTIWSWSKAIKNQVQQATGAIAKSDMDCHRHVNTEAYRVDTIALAIAAPSVCCAIAGGFSTLITGILANSGELRVAVPIALASVTVLSIAMAVGASVYSRRYYAGKINEGQAQAIVGEYVKIVEETLKQELQADPRTFPLREPGRTDYRVIRKDRIYLRGYSEERCRQWLEKAHAFCEQ